MHHEHQDKQPIKHGEHGSSASCCEPKAGMDHSDHIKQYKKRFWVSLALTIPVLLLSEMIQNWFGFELDVPFQKIFVPAFSGIIYFYGGWPFLRDTVTEIKNKKPGMMTLISMAISVSFFYSVSTIFFNLGKDFFWELATLIDVMLLGHWMEARSVMGASRALDELVKIIPARAHLIKGGTTVDIDVNELKVGDIALVKPGEKIPSDGIVIEGASSVNEALITGESKPVDKNLNDNVIGGAINGEGALKIKINKTGDQTYLSQIIKLVSEAQESKSKTQDLANKAAAILFYVAAASGIITYIVWLIIGLPEIALERSVTVLVIACPHALGLAIPLVVSLSTSITAKNGMLIRNRKAFESVRNIDAIVLDKTGTLTTGRFGVTDISSPAVNDTLALAAAVEKKSEHIIAQAIVENAQEKNIKIPKTSNFKAIPGKGASATVEGKEVLVGNRNLVLESNIKINEDAQKLEEQGKTTVYVIADKKHIGTIALTDQIRPESKDAIQKLKKMNIKTYMLTGDSERVARSVAEELKIDNYFAQVLPEEKADHVKSLQKQGLKVAMVGDGINDAPALATADVGIAIGAGTDVAIESAEIILVKNSPRDAVRIIGFSRKTYSKMLQNLWWAAGYNIIAIPLAAGILYSYGIILNPAIGALLMSLSTIIVALNAQTLRKYATL